MRKWRKWNEKRKKKTICLMWACRVGSDWVVHVQCIMTKTSSLWCNWRLPHSSSTRPRLIRIMYKLCGGTICGERRTQHDEWIKARALENRINYVRSNRIARNGVCGSGATLPLPLAGPIHPKMAQRTNEKKILHTTNGITFAFPLTVCVCECTNSQK